MQSVTVGIDLARVCPKYMASMSMAKWCCGAGFVEDRSTRSSVSSTLPDWHRSLRHCAFLGARADEPGTSGANYSSRLKAYVRRNKNDAADAAAICEALQRPTMCFVPVKTEEQQTALLLHKSGDLPVREQTMLVNALQGHMSELGLIASQGRGKARELVAIIEDVEDESISALAEAVLMPLVAQLRAAEEAIAKLARELIIWHKSSAASQWLWTVPDIGILTANAIAATIPDASAFKSGREFAAWIGLTPRQQSSGGKDRLGGISN